MEPESSLKIDLLYMSNCPSYRRVWNDLVEVITEENLDASVRLVRVDTKEEADRLHFAGSPTIKVDGRDLEGFAGPGSLACRLYPENGGKGWPSRTLLRTTLLERTGAKA
jgi:hypothetical protein